MSRKSFELTCTRMDREFARDCATMDASFNRAVAKQHADFEARVAKMHADFDKHSAAAKQSSDDFARRNNIDPETGHIDTQGFILDAMKEVYEMTPAIIAASNMYAEDAKQKFLRNMGAAGVPVTVSDLKVIGYM